VGLGEAEVATRVERGEVNKADIKTDKTKREIVLSNVCTYFNLIFLIYFFESIPVKGIKIIGYFFK